MCLKLLSLHRSYFVIMCLTVLSHSDQLSPSRAPPVSTVTPPCHSSTTMALQHQSLWWHKVEGGCTRCPACPVSSHQKREGSSQTVPVLAPLPFFELISKKVYGFVRSRSKMLKQSFGITKHKRILLILCE